SSLARKYEFIVIDNAESYLKLACAQRDKRKETGTAVPGDQVALYPPESAFELILKPHIYFQNLGGRLGKRSSGSGNAPQLTSQKNPPTGTTSSASTSLPASAVTSCQSSSTTRPSQATSTRRSSSTSLDSPSTTLGPNTAVADSRSKTKIVKVQLDVNLAVFAKRHARFLLVEKRRFSTYLIADWTAAGDNSSFLETVGSKFFATFDLLQLACRALSFRAAMLSLRDSSLRQNTACSRLLYFPPIFSYLHLLPLGNLLRRL
ncbi:unnamed protein product, partial [Oikopleura dioica]